MSTTIEEVLALIPSMGAINLLSCSPNLGSREPNQAINLSAAREVALVVGGGQRAASEPRRWRHHTYAEIKSGCSINTLYF